MSNHTRVYVSITPASRAIPIGAKFHRLTVIGEYTIRRAKRKGLNTPHYPCVCDCGARLEVTAEQLLSKSRPRTSCGCARHDPRTSRRINRTEDYYRIKRVWQSMISRCYCKTNHAYDDYGGRGITVDDAWRKSYHVFYEWALSAGYRSGLQIDRIDNDGGYSPQNCRWATRTQNQQNRRVNNRIEAFGEQKCIAEWPRDSRCVVGESCLRHRICAGWEPELAMTTPARRGWFGPREEEFKSKLSRIKRGLE